MILRALFLWIGLAASAVAQEMPQPLSDKVSDFAGVLDATEEGRIDRALQALRDETGVHMVVVTMATLDEHGGAGRRLEDYAKALFNAWGVGDAQRNDGILMLVVTGPREARIALGAGYDAVYDGRAARVLTTAVLPEFRAGRLAGGIEAGIASARERLVVPFQAGRPVTLTEGFEPEGGAFGTIAPWAAGAAGIGGLLSLVLWRARARRTCPKCGEQTLTRTREVITPSSRLSSGSGIEHMICDSCGFTDRQTFTIRATSRDRSRRSGGGGGGSGGGRSGGFGGGRSSGGGASGKW